MASRRTNNQHKIPTQDAKQIIRVPLAEEQGKSFLEYAMSVVYSRALPAIDGFKPVQRRILYAMFQDKYFPTGEYVKAARPVATTMGHFHPHGDSSIYGALVKMAQPWYLNVPLIDGYGNWGSAGGDGAAASRYTECKLTPAALLLLDELVEDTVDTRPNYDGKLTEPVLLPVQFPPLLINGGIGIAVGFSCNFAPHNPTEALNAVKYVVQHPDASLEEIMKYIPGPDFPTGAEILGTDGIKQAYETGEGKIRLRAKAEIEARGRGKHAIIFTEMPYQTDIEALKKKIKAALKAGKLEGIADAQDLTDRHNGVRFVVDIKAGVNPNVVLAKLYKNTPLEETFGINNTALVNGSPKQMSLKEMITTFIELRESVITRRTIFRKDKKDKRLHLINGLLKALADIDKVISIVRAAKDANTAQKKLMTYFKIDIVQADYILSIPLRRLTRFDQLALQKERKELTNDVIELQKILSSKDELKKVLLKELDEVKKAIGRPRLSTIVDGDLAEHLDELKKIEKTADVEIPDEDMNIVVYSNNTVTRLASNVQLTSLKDKGRSYPILNSIPSTTKSKVVLISNYGHGYRINVDQLHPGRTSTGNELVTLQHRGEKIIAVAPASADTSKPTEGYGIFFATEHGMVKITQPDYPARSDDFELIKLNADDKVVAASWVGGKQLAPESTVSILTTDSSLLTFTADKLRPQGRTGAGVTGIKLAAKAKVLHAALLSGQDAIFASVVTATSSSVKQSPLKDFPVKGRATGGVRSQAFLKGETHLVSGYIGSDPVLAVDKDWKEISLPAPAARRDASGKKSSHIPAYFGK